MRRPNQLRKVLKCEIPCEECNFALIHPKAPAIKCERPGEDPKARRILRKYYER